MEGYELTLVSGEDPVLKIDGESIVLTDDVINELLKIVNQKSVNPFARSQYGEKYYYISSCTNSVGEANETGHPIDTEVYASTNYFQDKSIANQVALHQWLYRKLLKFAWDNGAEDAQGWDTKNGHYGIIYNCGNHKFVPEVSRIYKSYGVYFSSKEVAERAIEEVVEPFVKEYPDFVW